MHAIGDQWIRLANFDLNIFRLEFAQQLDDYGRVHAEFHPNGVEMEAITILLPPQCPPELLRPIPTFEEISLTNPNPYQLPL